MAAGGWFRVGFGPAGAGGPGPCPEPARVGGGARAVRPSWSFVGLLGAAGGAALEGEAGRAALPADCRDLLPSETHVLLRRAAALEAWPLAAGPRLALAGRPVWRRELRAPEEEEEEEGAPAELPLVPGGYVVPKPDFFRPLSPALRARQLALGHEHVVLLGAAGALFTWGAGRHGQLGHGDLEGAAEPRLVEALQGLPMGQVAAGGWHSAGVSEAGDLYVWGWNESGQLGLPAKGMAESSGAAPAEADGSRTPASGTGDLYTWGWGKYGQLGHGDTATSDSPKKVCSFEARDLRVVDVVCGPWDHFCADHEGRRDLFLTAAQGQGTPEEPKRGLAPTEAASLTFSPTGAAGQRLNGCSIGQKDAVF